MRITYDSILQRFVFDFEHDGSEDIVSLTGTGYQVEAFGKCFYYGYEFAEQVDGYYYLQPYRLQRPDGRCELTYSIL